MTKVKASKPKAVVHPRKRAKKPAVVKHAVTEPAASITEKASAVRRTYLYAVGRRKTAVARVRYYQKGDGAVLVNQRPLEQYFTTHERRATARSPLTITNVPFGSLSIKVHGGGTQSQAEAVRHGIARVLNLVHPDTRPVLKKAGFLTRDARVKERKKYGLKRARRAPQWQKR